MGMVVVQTRGQIPQPAWATLTLQATFACEPNRAGCCGAFGSGGSLQARRALLANRRHEELPIIACESVARRFDVTQSTCLPGLALRSRRAGRTRRPTLPCHTLWARRSLLSGTTLRSGGSWRSRRPLRAGRPLRTGRTLRPGGSRGALGAFKTSGQQDRSRECDNDGQCTHANAPKCLRAREGSANFDLTHYDKQALHTSPVGDGTLLRSRSMPKRSRAATSSE